jgi:hypothetical protein
MIFHIFLSVNSGNLALELFFHDSKNSHKFFLNIQINTSFAKGLNTIL